MTRARHPRPQEVANARRDPRLIAAAEARDDRAWRMRGLCQDHDPETFFPAALEPADHAVAVCDGCPVAGACLAWALDAGDIHGVWGGTTARERRAMLVAWRTGEQPEEVAVAATMAPVTRLVVEGRVAAPKRGPVVVPAQRSAEHGHRQQLLVVGAERKQSREPAHAA